MPLLDELLAMNQHQRVAISGRDHFCADNGLSEGRRCSQHTVVMGLDSSWRRGMRLASPQTKLLIERGQLAQHFAPLCLVVALIDEDILEQEPPLLADIASGQVTLVDKADDERP